MLKCGGCMASKLVTQHNLLHITFTVAAVGDMHLVFVECVTPSHSIKRVILFQTTNRYWYLFFGLCPLSLCFFFFFFKPLRFEGWLFPRPQVKPTLLDPFDRVSLYLWTSNSAPSSKKFRGVPTDSLVHFREPKTLYFNIFHPLCLSLFSSFLSVYIISLLLSIFCLS
jgi:hypothetical protein